MRNQLLKCIEPVSICSKLCDKHRTLPTEGDPSWMVYSPAQCDFCAGSNSVLSIFIKTFSLKQGVVVGPG